MFALFEIHIHETLIQSSILGFFLSSLYCSLLSLAYFLVEKSIANPRFNDFRNVIIDLSADEHQTFVDACEPMWAEYEDGKYLDVINEALAVK